MTAKPNGLSIPHVRKVLAGDTSAIITAFHWVDTPQGINHWDRLFEGQRELTAEDREYLKSLLPVEPTKTAKPNTQVSQIINHMQAKGYITHRDAHIDYGVQSFTRRMKDIRELGYKVQKEASRHPTTNQLYYRYSFAA